MQILKFCGNENSSHGLVASDAV